MTEINITHDGILNIAVGKSRTSKSWPNEEIKWSELLKKLSKEVKTNETVAEYHSMSKDEQGKIKDKGGFVGGILKNSKRKAENVLSRRLITLDIDYGYADVWEDIQFLFEYTCCIYSTHSYTLENPRLRLVIPLNRDVTPDEYQAIARKMAHNFDSSMKIFDDTTYEPSRLMYWQSTPRDIDYIFKYQDGPFLNADEVLAEYIFGWNDVNSWPKSERETKSIKTKISRQQDPLTKDGIIGAFCRTYSIIDAIETFIPDEYDLVSDERGTYKNGSTFGGMVIYENKFSFSHHGTDPTSGMLCNSFDLIRVHKFAYLDDEVRSNTNMNKLPSMIKMNELARKDSKVMKDMINYSNSKAENEFEPIKDDEWLEQLEFSENTGKFKATSKNFKLIMENDPNIKDKISFDEFKQIIVVNGQLPWRKKGNFEEWGDNDDSALRNYIECVYKIRNKDIYNDSKSEIINKNSFHPIKAYLNSISWDGEKRIETLFIDYFGVEDNIFVRSFSKKWLCGAVKRILKPGCKFDYMLVLVGNQGVKKSTFFSKLSKEYFTDSIQDVNGKQAIEIIQGVWICEFGELQAFSRSDNEATKRFISATEDKYRPAYGHYVVNAKRQCVFAGTTNKAEFLTDNTGNRRYWILDCTNRRDYVKKDVFKDLKNELDQIWAEALYTFKQGIALYSTKEEEEYLSKYQEDYKSIDDVEQTLIDKLDWEAPEDKWREYTYTDLVLMLGLNERQKKYARNNLKAILAKMGVNQKTETTGKRRRVYSIPPTITDDF